MKIWIGCDHAGYERKQEVIALLKERQLEVEDCGCNGERADYPVIAKAVGTAVASHPARESVCRSLQTRYGAFVHHCAQMRFPPSTPVCTTTPM